MQHAFPRPIQAILRVNTQSQQEEEIAWDKIVPKAVHDMRTPLSAMKTTLEVMRMAGSDPDKVAKLLAMLERQANEITALSDRLLKDPGSFAEKSPLL